MNLIAIAQHLAPRSRPSTTNQSLADERLRRAGYADGERQPRKQSHWANR